MNLDFANQNLTSEGQNTGTWEKGYGEDDGQLLGKSCCGSRLRASNGFCKALSSWLPLEAARPTWLWPWHSWACRAAFVTVLPDKNPMADAVIGELRRFGVDTSRIVRGKGRMGIYYVEAGANQRPSKVVYDRDNSVHRAGQAGRHRLGTQRSRMLAGFTSPALRPPLASQPPTWLSKR